MTYVVDIDGTICTKTKDGTYTDCRPFLERIKKLNVLFEKNEIIYFTARGMGRHKGNQSLAIKQFFQLTAEQLAEWGVQYNQLMLGKPAADVYIDDKGINDESFFSDRDEKEHTGNKICF